MKTSFLPVAIAVSVCPHVSSAALIHHYTFDSSIGADSGTIGGRTLTEQTIGAGGNVSLVSSVTDTNGFTRSGVLRVTGETQNGDANTVNGSWFEHDTGSSTILSTYTVALWYRTDVSDNAGFSSMFSNGPSSHFQIDNGTNGVNPDGIRLLGQSGVTVTDSGSFATNVWTHVAVTYDGTTARFYVNGSEFWNGNANPGGQFQEIRLASNRGQTRLFDGDFDDFQIHDTALDASSISALAAIPEPSTSSFGLLVLCGCVLRRKR